MFATQNLGLRFNWYTERKAEEGKYELKSIISHRLIFLSFVFLQVFRRADKNGKYGQFLLDHLTILYHFRRNHHCENNVWIRKDFLKLVEAESLKFTNHTNPSDPVQCFLFEVEGVLKFYLWISNQFHESVINNWAVKNFQYKTMYFHKNHLKTWQLNIL